VPVIRTSGTLALTIEDETNFNGRSSIPELQLGVQQGNPVAEAILGYYMVHGIRVDNDVKQGVGLIRSSAEQGFIHGMAALGNLYMTGKYVPQDFGQAMHWLQLAALNNDSDAERDIGVCYEMGFDGTTNYGVAATWYRKAAEHTNFVAMKDLGVLYMNGTGVPKDYETAKYWLKLAADRGNYARAMYDLGVLGDKGAFGTNSFFEAVKWYQRGAGMGDPLAYWNLALHYRNGVGVSRNLGQFIYWAGEAAEAGLNLAQMQLGEAYRVGFGVPKNKAISMAWYRAAATNNFPPAFYFLALGLSEEKNNHEAQLEACHYLLLAAKAGNPEAQFQYAMQSFRGNIIPQDVNQGKQWLECSAESGWAKAEFKLSQFYFNGTMPFPENEAAGVKWLRRAAEHNHVEAQWRLAERLYAGTGVDQDHTEAMKWFMRAADTGYANAQNDLGYAIETDASKGDLIEACKWYQLAANQGVDMATINLKAVMTKLSAEQRQEVLRRVKVFHPKPVVVPSPFKEDDHNIAPSLNIRLPD